MKSNWVSCVKLPSYLFVEISAIASSNIFNNIQLSYAGRSDWIANRRYRIPTLLRDNSILLLRGWRLYCYCYFTSNGMLYIYLGCYCVLKQFIINKLIFSLLTFRKCPVFYMECCISLPFLPCQCFSSFILLEICIMWIGELVKTRLKRSRNLLKSDFWDKRLLSEIVAGAFLYLYRFNKFIR